MTAETRISPHWSFSLLITTSINQWQSQQAPQIYHTPPLKNWLLSLVIHLKNCSSEEMTAELLFLLIVKILMQFFVLVLLYKKGIFTSLLACRSVLRSLTISFKNVSFDFHVKGGGGACLPLLYVLLQTFHCWQPKSHLFTVTKLQANLYPSQNEASH